MSEFTVTELHEYSFEHFPSAMAHVYLWLECTFPTGQNRLITFEKKKKRSLNWSSAKCDELYPWFIPFGPFDVGKLADLPCPPFLIKLSSAANVHFHGVAPSWLRSIVPVRERSLGVIGLGDATGRIYAKLWLDLYPNFNMETWYCVYTGWKKRGKTRTSVMCMR